MGLKQRLGRVPVLGTGLAVQERYTGDGADPLAAGIGFFAFLSLFPLILLAVSVAGFVLDDPADQLAVAEAITDAIPGFDAAAGADGSETAVAELVEGVVGQRGTIGLVGGVLLLLSGLRVVNGAMIATRVVFRGEVQKGVVAKVRQLLALVGLGALGLLGVAASSLAGAGLGPLPAIANLALSTAVTFAFDLLLFLGAYTLLSGTSVLTVRQHVPGAILGAAGWTVLKVAGAAYVGSQVDSANALYGALGGVIALLLLFYLAGRLYLYGAELSAVRYERDHGALHPPVEDGDAPAAGVPVGGAAALDGPPPPPRIATRPRPRDPGPGGHAPTVGEGTRQRLDVAERRRVAVEQERDPGADARHTVAIGIGLAALAAGYRWLRSDDQ